MFNNLGKIDYKVKSEIIEIELANIVKGVNFTEEFII